MRPHGTGSITRLRGGRHLARLPESLGRGSIGTYDTEEDARVALAIRMEEIARGDDTDSLTVDRWGQRWLTAREASGSYRHVAQERARWSVYVTGSPLGRLPLRDVEASDVRAWLGALKGTRRAKLSGSTRANALTIVRAALTGAVEAGHIAASPAAGVRLARGAMRKTHEGWSWLRADELEAMLLAAPNSKARSLWTVGAYAGLRTGELLGLRWADVDFERSELTVRHTRDDAPKTQRALRVVQLLEPARDALHVWRTLSASVRSRAGLVWTSPTGGCHVLGYDAGFAETRRAVLPGRRCTIRDLRHTCASHLLQGTWAPGLIARALRLEEVRDWLGHTSITVTQRYAHLASDGARSLVRTRALPVELVAERSHFRELNPGPTVYETDSVTSDAQRIRVVSSRATSRATSSRELAAEVGRWICAGKAPPVALTGRLVESVLLEDVQGVERERTA